MAPATIEDCFFAMITARKIAETFRTLVMVLSDANLATGQQAFNRPAFNPDWMAPPIDQSPLPAGHKPYDWDPVTGLSTFMGTHVTRAARIEPTVEVGQIFVSDAFAALAAADPSCGFRCDYVGEKVLPKNAGPLRLYLLRG